MPAVAATVCAIGVALCLGGCRSIHYTHKPDGTIEAVYNNFGFDTSVDGLTIKKNAEGVEVQVSKYNSQTQAFEVAGKALDLANKVAK